MTAILQAQRRSALVRRHRHLCARFERDRRPGRRPRQRRRSASPAPTLRCKVVGEGANLGMTQRGRVEAAMRGVRLNTDAIDNSAGVNTSDVEVNIKIALSAADARRLADLDGAQRAARRDDRRGRRAWCCATIISRRWRSRSRSGAGSEDLGFHQRLMQIARERAASSTARSSTCPTTWSSASGASAGRR